MLDDSSQGNDDVNDKETEPEILFFALIYYLGTESFETIWE